MRTRSSQSYAFVLALATTAAVGCGKTERIVREIHDGATSGVNKQSVADIPRNRVEDVRRMEAVCPDTANCSDSIAQIGFATPKKFGLCTATLIADDLLLTSAHCVPASDESFIGMAAFPRTTDLPSETVEILEVVVASADGKVAFERLPAARAIDYAILQLARKVSRPTLKLSGEAIREGAGYRAVVVGSFRFVEFDANGNVSYGKLHGEPGHEVRRRLRAYRSCGHGRTKKLLGGDRGIRAVLS